MFMNAAFKLGRSCLKHVKVKSERLRPARNQLTLNFTAVVL